MRRENLVRIENKIIWIMDKVTRSRQNLRSKRETIETVDAVDGTNETKKRKVNPLDSPRRSKRGDDVAKADTEQAKPKRKLNSAINDVSLQSHDIGLTTNAQKSPRKLKRTNTATKLEAKQTKSKPTKSQPKMDDTQKASSSHVLLTEKISEAHACANAIEQVLAANYVDVQKRLKLLYPAKCIQSLLTCHKKHVRNLV